MNALSLAASDDGDLFRSLDALVKLRKEADRREEILVQRARVQGLTWAEIAFLLGVSKQAVHKKYGKFGPNRTSSPSTSS